MSSKKSIILGMLAGLGFILGLIAIIWVASIYSSNVVRDPDHKCERGQLA
jgi:hypothetical protein